MVLNRNIILAAAAAGVVALGAGGTYYWKTQRDIHNIDFRNGPVEIFGTACADPDLTSAAVTTVPLHDGAYQLGKYQFELVGDVRYGDVSGQTSQDAGDKAVFVGSCNNGGSTSQVLFVYGMQDGKLTRLATADLSGGGSSIVQSYSIGNGAIQIRENQGSPPQLVTVSYALLGGQLQNVGGGGSVAPTRVAASTDTATSPSDDINDTSGDDKISFQYFHDQLSPYGEWIDHPRWGQVWRPNAESADFRPYRDGHWENTDEYGMTWVSNTDWGDIVYHYGRWAYDPEDKWVWVPDYTWAPSWVVWRAGEGHVGWLPMPPGDYEGEGEYPDAWGDWYGYRDWNADMAAEEFYGLWSFVDAADLLAPNLGVYFVQPAVFGRFIGRTHGWTRYGVFRGRIVDRSFERGRFEAAFHRRLPVTHAHNLFHHPVPKTSAHGGLRIAAHEHQSGHGAHTASTGRTGVHGGPRMHAGFDRHGIASGHGLSRHVGTSGFARGYGHAGGFGRSEGFARSLKDSGTGIPSRGIGRSDGFARSSGRGFARSGGGFAHAGNGFSRSSGQGFARSGSSGGFARSGSAAGGYGRSGYGGGFSRGSTGGGFGRSGFGGQNGIAPGAGFNGANRNFGGGGRSFGGGNAFGGQRAAAPRVSGNNSSGNSGNRHHGH